MSKRHKAREIVLQALYEVEFSDLPWEQVLANQTDRREPGEETINFARELLGKVVETRAALDEKIRAALVNWEFERVTLIDKNILRFALAEILFFPEVPAPVIMNEAIEVAHRYSSRDAGKFINGVLDRLVSEYREDSV